MRPAARVDSARRKRWVSSAGPSGESRRTGPFPQTARRDRRAAVPWEGRPASSEPRHRTTRAPSRSARVRHAPRRASKPTRTLPARDSGNARSTPPRLGTGRTCRARARTCQSPRRQRGWPLRRPGQIASGREQVHPSNQFRQLPASQSRASGRSSQGLACQFPVRAVQGSCHVLRQGLEQQSPDRGALRA